MDLKRLVCIFMLAVAVLPVQGCSNDKKPTTTKSRSIAPSVSTKLGLVSKAFLDTEKENAGQATHDLSVMFADSGTGVAYVEPFDGKYRVVNNGKPGKPYLHISHLTISNDGKRIAYVARVSERAQKMIVDGKAGFEFGNNDNHWFTPDSKHHLSTVSEGDNRYLVIDNKDNRTFTIEQGVVISSDSSAIAFSSKSPDGNSKQFIISDIQLKNKSVFDSCGDFILPNEDTSRLAVSCSQGGKSSIKLIDLLSRSVISDSKYNGTITYMRFSPYNNSLSYTCVVNEKEKHIVYNGKEERIPAGEEFMSDPLVFSEPESVGVIVGDVYKVRLYRAFQKRNKNGKWYGYISDLVSSRDGRSHAYIATNINDEQMHIVVNAHDGPKFDKIVSPLFSPDGRYLVYRARQAGKRFVVVSDLKGKIMRRHQDYDMLFQPVFTADGTSLAYGVLDGNEFWWKVEKL